MVEESRSFFLSEMTTKHFTHYNNATKWITTNNFIPTNTIILLAADVLEAVLAGLVAAEAAA
jgi:hypothetical protein